VFYERQRMRASTYGVPRFLYSFDETIDGGLILPRGMLGAVTSLAEEAGSRLELTDERSAGSDQDFTCTATLTTAQREAAAELIHHDLGVLVAPPGSGKTALASAPRAHGSASSNPNTTPHAAGYQHASGCCCGTPPRASADTPKERLGIRALRENPHVLAELLQSSEISAQAEGSGGLGPACSGDGDT
jgi:hypothetical protein